MCLSANHCLDYAYIISSLEQTNESVITFRHISAKNYNENYHKRSVLYILIQFAITSITFECHRKLSFLFVRAKLNVEFSVKFFYSYS